MTQNAFALADKLRDRYYIFDDARAYSYKSSAYGRRTRGKLPNYRYARLVADGRRTAHGLVARETVERNKVEHKEVKVKGKYLNPLFIAAVAVAAVMLFALISCLSDVYESAHTVGNLRMTLSDLESERTELQFSLDARYDLTEIEKYATVNLGRVKEELTQRRFISLSEGEHIDVNEPEEQTGAGGGVLLSSLFSSIGDFFDRFR